jgi:hypothetical protein
MRPTRPKFRSTLRRPGWVFALLVLLASGGGWAHTPAAPTGPSYGHSGGTIFSHSAVPAVSGASGEHPNHAAPSAPVYGPLHGRYFEQSVTTPTGVASDAVGLAVDTSRQVAFVANDRAGLVTAFAIGSGALVNAVPVGPGIVRGSCLCGVALDTINHTLFVSVTASGRPGWIQVLNESTLATIGNITVSSFPAPPFEPFLSTFDPVSDQVFVQNETGGWTVAINASTGSVRAVLPCSVVGCVSEGVTVVAGWDDLVVPTLTSSLLVFNSSTDVAKPTISAPLTASIGPVAYDSHSRLLIAANESSAPTVFLNFSPASGIYLGSFGSIPASVTDLAYDERTDILITSDAALHQRLTGFNATTGALVGLYNASRGPGTFQRLALDAPLGGILTVGTLNNTTAAFELPSLLPTESYPSLPYFQTDSAVDPRIGVFYVASLWPGEIEAFSEPTGTLEWTIYPPTPLFNGLAIVVDPAHDTLFEAAPSSAAVHLYNASTGAVAGAIPLSRPALALGLDDAHDLLYVSEQGRVQVFSTVSHLYLGFVPLPGLSACGIVVDDAVAAAFLESCSAPNGNVTTVYGANLTLGRIYGAGSDPVDGAVLPDGDIVIANGGGTNLTEIDPVNRSNVGSVGLAPFVPGDVVTDLTDRLLLVTSLFNNSVEVLDTSGLVVLATLPLLQSVYRAGFDNLTGTLVAPFVAGGRVELYSGVTHPSAPSPPTVQSGNTTLAISWNRPGDGGAPIVSFNLSISTSPTGPWSLAISTNSTVTNLTGLSDGVTYYLTVAAANFAGTGPTSNVASGTPVGVPFPVRALTVGNATNSTLNVSWAPPSSTEGAPVLNYTVEFERLGSANWSTATAGTSLAWRIVGLEPSTNYTVRVVAWNAVGPSNAAADAVARTLATPVRSGPPGPHSSPGSLAVDVWLGILIGVIVASIVATLLMLRRRRPPPDKPVSTVPPVPMSSWSPPAAWSEDDDQGSGGSSTSPAPTGTEGRRPSVQLPAG